MLSNHPFEIPSYLIEKSRGLPPQRIAVAGADNAVALESARQAADGGLADPVLVGDVDKIRALADGLGWDIGGHRLVDAAGEVDAARAAVALASAGEVSAVMKGHVHTDVLMRAVLNRDAGLRAGRRLSHVFHMTVPGSDRVLYITDCALNVAPDADTKIDIVRNAVALAHALGTEKPKVALLSASESVSEAMPSTVRAAEVVARAKAGEVDGALVDGPLAFDLAVSPRAAEIKGVTGDVVGQADILVVPNIETGNALFKMMVHLRSALAAGIVFGAKVPIVLTSRADPPEARYAATAIAAIAAASGS